jgi:23S rRNA pseudouridine1911/1915/1917 synthase
MSEIAPLSVRPNDHVEVPVLHEDPDFLILDKPAGMVTQPGKGHANDSLLNGVFALRDGFVGKLLQNLGVRRDFGLLHRLDKDTSGLLVIAKTPNAYDQLRRDFENRDVDKEYLAIIAGIPKPAQGVVQARLKEVQVPNVITGYGSIKKSVISRQGEEAITSYRTLSATPDSQAPAALVHLKIKTGRLHQIRAHMIYLNCQVLGDDLYLPSKEAGIEPKRYPHAPRLCLHAGRLGFKLPATGKWTHFESPLPRDLAAYAARLGLSTEQKPQKSKTKPSE